MPATCWCARWSAPPRWPAGADPRPRGPGRRDRGGGRLVRAHGAAISLVHTGPDHPQGPPEHSRTGRRSDRMDRHRFPPAGAGAGPLCGWPCAPVPARQAEDSRRLHSATDGIALRARQPDRTAITGLFRVASTAASANSDRNRNGNGLVRESWGQWPPLTPFSKNPFPALCCDAPRNCRGDCATVQHRVSIGRRPCCTAR